MSETFQGCLEHYSQEARQATERLLIEGPTWLRRLLPADDGAARAGELYFRWVSAQQRTEIVTRICHELQPYFTLRCRETARVAVERVVADCLLYVGVRDRLPCSPVAALQEGAAPAADALPWLILLFEMLLETVEITIAQWREHWLARRPGAGGRDRHAERIYHRIGEVLANISQEAKEQLVLNLLKTYVVDKVLAAPGGQTYWSYTFDPGGRVEYRPFELGLRNLARLRTADLLPKEAQVDLERLKEDSAPQPMPSGTRPAAGESALDGLAIQIEYLRAYLADRLEMLREKAHMDHALARLQRTEATLQDKALARLLPEVRVLITSSAEGSSPETSTTAALRILAATMVAPPHRVDHTGEERPAVSADRLRRARERLFQQLRIAGREQLDHLVAQDTTLARQPQALLDRTLAHLKGAENDTHEMGGHQLPDLAAQLLDTLVVLTQLCWTTTRSYVDISTDLTGVRPRRGNQPGRSLFHNPRGIAEAFPICVATVQVYRDNEAEPSALSGAGR